MNLFQSAVDALGTAFTGVFELATSPDYRYYTAAALIGLVIVISRMRATARAAHAPTGR